jgi:N-acylneuraminate cytidylyltransferase
MSELKIAVIPARGGSKRIPKKNIRMFAGKPMIAWSIEAGLSSGCFDQVVVSTDDDEIAAVARDFGADVPFVRPHDLSDDFTPTAPVIAHAIDWFARRGNTVDYACCIYATAPFIQVADLQCSFNLLRESDVDYVYPVTTFPYPIERALLIGEDNRVSMMYPQHGTTRSQDLTEAFHDAGQFYWGTSAGWSKSVSILSSSSIGLRIPRARVQDIDTVEDFERAEMMFKSLLENG